MAQRKSRTAKTKAGTVSKTKDKPRKAPTAKETPPRKPSVTKGADPNPVRQGKPALGAKKARGPSAKQILEMIADATVDAHDDEELAMGWHGAISDNLAVPFTTQVLGVEVEVTEIDLTERDEIVAVCKRGKQTQRVPVLDLPLPDPPPKGHEWIEAFRQWGG